MGKLSSYALLGSAQDDDVVPIVDVHDLSMAPSGTTKKIRVDSLLGSGGIQRMPWNLLGGWVGSSYDQALAEISINLGQNLFQPSTGSIYAQAVVVDTATAFSTVVLLGGAAQTGTGTLAVVTDVSGNWVANVTNADAAFTGISSSLEYVNLTLNTPVTPSAAQEIYYFVLLCPTATVSVAPQFWAGAQLPNWISNQSEVAFPSAAANFGPVTSIPSPAPVSAMLDALNQPLWFAVK